MNGMLAKKRDFAGRVGGLFYYAVNVGLQAGRMVGTLGGVGLGAAALGPAKSSYLAKSSGGGVDKGDEGAQADGCRYVPSAGKFDEEGRFHAT